MRDYSDEVIIRPANQIEWEPVMEMVWKTFLKYEAPEYSDEGIYHFREFITDESLYKMFCAGFYQIFVAVYRDKIVGMISLRDVMHISLLFVDANYHRRGIGRKLVLYLWNYLNTEMGIYQMTVNAAPFGIPFYQKVGFVALDTEQQSDGIRYTPMKFRKERIEYNGKNI